MLKELQVNQDAPIVAHSKTETTALEVVTAMKGKLTTAETGLRSMTAQEVGLEDAMTIVEMMTDHTVDD